MIFMILNGAKQVMKKWIEEHQAQSWFKAKKSNDQTAFNWALNKTAGQVGEIISRFEKKGFALEGFKLITVEHSFAKKQYEDLSAKPFFGGLVEYIISGPVFAMIWESKYIVATGRKITGATNPTESAPGTIRGDFAIDIDRNVIRGSDSVGRVTKEIALWFLEGPVNW